MERSVVIVAGGKGLRMGTDLPKQFLLLGNRPVLMHTLNAFHTFDPDMQIVLVLPVAQQDYWKSLCRQYHFEVPHTIANGGETRFHSVKNGLALVEGKWIAIHDGVRPFVSKAVIQTCFEAVQTAQAVIPVIPVVDTVRHLCGAETSETVNRNDYRLVQTPQVFDALLLRKAYDQTYTDRFTDDASVVEAMGIPVSLVDGNRENIKITTPFDLKVGTALLG